MIDDGQTVGYTWHDKRYLNVTNRCTLRCAFCPSVTGKWILCGHDLRLSGEPTSDELLAAAHQPDRYREVVFCGFGEPTLRLYDILSVAAKLRRDGGCVRINTDGLANLIYRRDVTPDLEGNVDALSISLNAQNEEVYNRHFRPSLSGSYAAMLDFARRAREFVPKIILTAVDGLPGVDINQCAQIAGDLGVEFRKRRLSEFGWRAAPEHGESQSPKNP